MKEQKEKKPRKISKVFAKTTDHFMEHKHWDFPPEMPQPGKMEDLLKKAQNRMEQISTESICGSMDDMQHVEQYDGTLGVTQTFVAAHERPVGQLQWNNNLATIYTNPGTVNDVRWCSGTLIANDLFLTAGHCFDVNPDGWQTPRDNGTGMSVQPAQLALNMHVNFNFQVDPMGNLRTEQSFPVTQLVEYRLGGLDFAIARLGGNPGATFGVATISNVDANDTDMLCIIQHPAGLPKRIEAGPQFHVHDDQLGYDTLDTLGGSSGSGILRETTGSLVGVHTNGGCASSGAGHNHGTRISSIIVSSPTIRAILHPIIWPTLKGNDDHVTLKFRDDFPPTLKGNDDHVTLKFRDDFPPTLKFNDDRQTFKFIDDPKLKVVDDVYQKVFGDPIIPKNDGDPWMHQNWFINQLRSMSATGISSTPAVQPFILANPHHSMEWQKTFGTEAGQEQTMLAQYEQQLIQLEQSIQYMSEQLQQANEYYTKLMGEYQAIVSQYNQGKGPQ